MLNLRKWPAMRKGLHKPNTGREQREGGQALVEFAFTIPIILILFISVVLLSFMLYSFVTLSHGAREGARYIIGAPHATDTEVEDYVKTKLGLLDPARAVIELEPEAEDRQPGANVTVTISYPFQLVNVYVPYIITPGGLTMFPPTWLRAVSTMYMD